MWWGSSMKTKKNVRKRIILDKNGDIKFCFVESEDKVNKSYYHCQKCNKKWMKDETKIKDIAEWRYS